MRLSLILGLVTAAASILLYELFATDLVRLFLDDARTVELAASFLRARVLATPLMFMSFFTVFLFQAFGRGDISLLLGTVRWLALQHPHAVHTQRRLRHVRLVWAQVTADTLTVAMSLAVYLRFRPPLLRPAPDIPQIPSPPPPLPAAGALSLLISIGHSGFVAFPPSLGMVQTFLVSFILPLTSLGNPRLLRQHNVIQRLGHTLADVSMVPGERAGWL